MVDSDNPTKLKIDLKDDIRQTFIVMKYEMIKFKTGKKIYIYGIVNIIALVAMAVALFINSNTVTTEGALRSFISLLNLILLIGATLFSSVTLVSEFEEKTSLVLFTKPIRRASIFFGKFLAAYILNFGFTVVYYILAAIVVLVKTGGFTPNMFISIGFCMAYIFALTGIAMFFSSVMKKSSSASILTFVFLLLVPSIITAIVVAIQGNITEDSFYLWYMIDTAWSIVPDSIAGQARDGALETLVMLIWGIIPTAIACRVFRKKQI